MVTTLLLSLIVQVSNGQGTLSIKQDVVAAQPVVGSKVLLTEFQITSGSSAAAITAAVIELETIVAKMKNKSGAEKKALENQMRSVVSAILDLQHLGQRAMVTHWENLGKTAKLKKMRDNYMKLFRQLIEENYMEQARKYIGGNYQIIFTSQDEKGTKPMVKGRIKKTDVDVLVEFDVVKQGSAWKVQDIRLDTTSLEATYRSSFNRLIKRKGGLDAGFPELLKSMEKRLAELRSGSSKSL